MHPSRALPILAAMAISLALPLSAADIKIGIIGLDTSHVAAFTELLNNPANAKHVPGGRVVAAFKGGSPDIPSSASRVEGYTRELQDRYQVKIVDSIESLCSEVDAVLLESVDGRPHLEQARPIFRARKPVFIDKPIAGSLRDAVEIVRLAKESGVPCFSSSSYRFYESMQELKKADVGKLMSAVSYGPAEKEPHHPDLFWYGVHPVEGLFTVMGPGCQSVSRTASDATDVVVGMWSEGRTGTLLGLRTGATPHKVIVFGSKSVAEQKGSGDYAPLVREIVQFFKSGKSPVSLDETLELFAFMEAADESKRQGGKPVAIADVLKAAGQRP
ncbi:MAG: Gfo/Idh/MocA family oxidoreductase [Verrucomicrobia bacterium]|nr:Gfo/Idh/MocA family oxidoreductase [Verrucomicrobiota bacterium]MBI3868109.1 Gfo/Idh/MocA family oxidoreductase [Verrucomicrobiota bacterium]